MALRLVTPPATEPVSLAEAKLQCALGSGNTAWDDFLTGKITSARQICEQRVCRSFINTVWDVTLEGFPTSDPWSLERLASGRLRFPLADVVSVDSVTYLDANGAAQTLAGSEWQLATGPPWTLVPAYGKAWPGHRRYPDALTVRFTAGYGAAATDVPQNVRDAILMFVQHLFENRGLVVTGTIVTPIPDTVQALLDPADWGKYL